MIYKLGLGRLGGGLLLFLAEILLVGAAFGNELQEAAAGVKVFFVLLQMSGQFVNPLGEDGDLDLRRASVLLVDLGLLDYRLLLLG